MWKLDICHLKNPTQNPQNVGLLSNSQVTKKLAGKDSKIAAWVTNVGNEVGQILQCVLTEKEGNGLQKNVLAGMNIFFRGKK